MQPKALSTWMATSFIHNCVVLLRRCDLSCGCGCAPLLRFAAAAALRCYACCCGGCCTLLLALHRPGSSLSRVIIRPAANPKLWGRTLTGPTSVTSRTPRAPFPNPYARQRHIFTRVLLPLLNELNVVAKLAELRSGCRVKCFLALSGPIHGSNQRVSFMSKQVQFFE